MVSVIWTFYSKCCACKLAGILKCHFYFEGLKLLNALFPDFWVCRLLKKKKDSVRVCTTRQNKTLALPSWNKCMGNSLSFLYAVFYLHYGGMWSADLSLKKTLFKTESWHLTKPLAAFSVGQKVQLCLLKPKIPIVIVFYLFFRCSQSLTFFQSLFKHFYFLLDSC